MKQNASNVESAPAVAVQRVVKQQVELLKEILEHQVANLNNPHGHEFYRCYTYNPGDMPAWVRKAKRLVLLNGPDQGRRASDSKTL
jgi:hypothetical protein